MAKHMPGPSYSIGARWAGSRFCGCRITRDRYRRPVVEECCLHVAAIDILGALESAFVAMGMAGANADTAHPLRPSWELARAAIRKAQGG